jgi:hypothetical protein
VRQETSAYILALADLLVITAWLANGWFIQVSFAAYLAYGGLMMLLGFLGFVIVHRLARHDERHPLMVVLSVPSALLLLLPPGSLVLMLGFARALSGF